MSKIFFYGLFMDRSLLTEKGLHPRLIGPAVLPDYRIHIGERATLLRSASSRAFGLVMELADEEAGALYSEPSVREYSPERVQVEMLNTNEAAEAFCYNLPRKLALAGANPTYATKLSQLVATLGFDSAYVEEIAAFGNDRSPVFDLEELSRQATRWILEQRAEHRPRSSPIDAGLRAVLSPHFSDSTLEAARLARVPVVKNPGFYKDLHRIPMDLRGSAGITYDDTVLISDRHVGVPPPPSLVFHELVHVVQYSILGVAEFARRYVQGWATSGYEYRRIPLEVQAYDLERRFMEGDLGERTLEDLVRQEL